MKIKFAYGTTRTTILIGKYAIKIPSFVEGRLFLHGLLGNMQEKTFSGMDEKLCPVIFSFPGGFLNIMLRAESISREEFFSLDYDEWVITKDKGPLPVEYKLDSFGGLNGKLVAVDYGS